MTLKKSRMDYKWVILVICFLMEFLCLGFGSSNQGLYEKALISALEIQPQTLYGLSSSIRYAVQVITALYFGTLVNKFGTWKMVFVGLFCMTASVLIRGLATEFYHLYFSSVFWGVGIVFTGGTMAGTIVRRWFHQNVGKYTGLVMSANGIGGAVAAQIISPLINNGETFGYRKAYFLSAVISLGISIVILIFLRERPKNGENVPVTSGKRTPRGAMWSGIPYDVVKKKPFFYAVAAMVFITGISIQSIGSISILHAQKVGIPDVWVTASVTVSSLCLACAKFLVGMAYDKKGLRFTLYICLFAAIGAFLLKALLPGNTLGIVMMMTATIISAFAAPVETVMLPLLSNDLFGSASYNKVLGILMAMNSLGLCLGSSLGHAMYDIFGDYRPSFWLFSVSMAAVVIGYRFAIRAAYRQKEQIELSEKTV